MPSDFIPPDPRSSKRTSQDRYGQNPDLHDNAAGSSYGRNRPPYSENSSLYGDRPSRLWLLWHKKRNTLRLGIGLLILLGVSAGCGWMVMTVLPNKTRLSFLSKVIGANPFVIHHILIHGQQLTDKETLLNALGTKTGDPLLGLSLEEARQNINNLPFVENSVVERIWPDTISITVTERVPVAIWQYQGRFVLINQKGKIISSHDITPDDSSVFSKLPLVVGAGANMEANSILELLSHYPDLQGRIIAFIRIGERRWNLMLKNGSMILMPEGSEDAAFRKLTQYQAEMQLLDRPVASIDMRLPDRMVIHVEPVSSASLPPSGRPEISHETSDDIPAHPATTNSGNEAPPPDDPTPQQPSTPTHTQAHTSERKQPAHSASKSPEAKAAIMHSTPHFPAPNSEQGMTKPHEAENRLSSHKDNPVSGISATKHAVPKQSISSFHNSTSHHSLPHKQDGAKAGLDGDHSSGTLPPPVPFSP